MRLLSNIPDEHKLEAIYIQLNDASVSLEDSASSAVQVQVVQHNTRHQAVVPWNPLPQIENK